MAKTQRSTNVNVQHYNAVYEHMSELEDDNKWLISELNYYAAFIKWKNLNDEFEYFKKNAFEIHDEDFPFPILTL